MRWNWRRSSSVIFIMVIGTNVSVISSSLNWWTFCHIWQSQSFFNPKINNWQAESLVSQSQTSMDSAVVLRSVDSPQDSPSEYYRWHSITHPSSVVVLQRKCSTIVKGVLIIGMAQGASKPDSAFLCSTQVVLPISFRSLLHSVSSSQIFWISKSGPILAPTGPWFESRNNAFKSSLRNCDARNCEGSRSSSPMFGSLPLFCYVVACPPTPLSEVSGLW
jgi:hypothetical protein